MKRAASMLAKHARRSTAVFAARTARSVTSLGAAGRLPASVPHMGLVSAPRRGMADLPAHTVVSMPALSPTMEAGTLTSWELSPGDTFAPGDVLAQVETDKATVDFESTDDGVLAKVLVQAGTADIPCGTPVAVIVEDAGDVAAFEGVDVSFFSAGEADPASAPAPAPAPAAAAPAPTPAPAAAPAVNTAPGDRVIASPAARRILRENGVDLSSMSGGGSGPGGRILAGDVLAALQSGDFPSAAGEASAAAGEALAAAGGAGGAPFMGVGDARGFTDYAVPAGRLASAALFTASKQAVPHYYLTTEVTLDAVLALRQRLNAVLGGGAEEEDVALSLNDVLVKAAGLALKRVPEVNSSWFGDAGFVRAYDYADVAVVMSTADGIAAPVVRDADSAGLASISAGVKNLASAAADGSLGEEDLSGATFTITNLGGYGVKQFSPIVVPPQACALGVGAVSRKVVPAAAGAEEGSKFAVETSLAVTLSCDHRVVDGAVGAEWLAQFKGLLENPETMLL